MNSRNNSAAGLGHRQLRATRPTARPSRRPGQRPTRPTGLTQRRSQRRRSVASSVRRPAVSDRHGVVEFALGVGKLLIGGPGFRTGAGHTGDAGLRASRRRVVFATRDDQRLVAVSAGLRDGVVERRCGRRAPDSGRPTPAATAGAASARRAACSSSRRSTEPANSNQGGEFTDDGSDRDCDRAAAQQFTSAAERTACRRAGGCRRPAIRPAGPTPSADATPAGADQRAASPTARPATEQPAARTATWRTGDQRPACGHALLSDLLSVFRRQLQTPPDISARRDTAWISATQFRLESRFDVRSDSGPAPGSDRPRLTPSRRCDR